MVNVWRTSTEGATARAVPIAHGKAVGSHGRFKWIIQRIPTGPHSGRATITTSAPRPLRPVLLLEGTHSARAATAKAKCPFFSKGGPCLGTLMSDYSYEGEGGQSDQLMKAKFGPREVVGTRYQLEPAPGQYHLTQHKVTWHSVASVEILAVYEVHEVRNGFKYHKLPSGRHRGHAKLTAWEDTDPPILVLFGDRD